jgi:hypothetical protein
MNLIDRFKELELEPEIGDFFFDMDGLDPHDPEDVILHQLVANDDYDAHDYIFHGIDVVILKEREYKSNKEDMADYSNALEFIDKPEYRSFSKDDLFEAFRHYAFASISDHPYSEEELEEAFDEWFRTKYK